jgi:hypothetical protein
VSICGTGTISSVTPERNGTGASVKPEIRV